MATNLYSLGAYEKQIITRKGSHGFFVGTSGGWRSTLISGSGLYKLTMRSNMPEAKKFQEWVTEVVLPAIRKDGGYVAGEKFYYEFPRGVLKEQRGAYPRCPPRFAYSWPEKVSHD